MKTTSGLAVAAAAGLFATSAMAADLGYGGNCCADLEERVAELEATTARKGNRVVSLTVYGRLTHGILWHDDEDGYREGTATIRDDSASPTMFGFRGEALISPGFSAGYTLEFGVSADNGTGGSDFISLRHNYVYLDSETAGRVSLGHTSQVTDGLYEISLANTVVTPGGLNEEGSVLNDALTLPWEYAFDGDRKQGIYYRSPTIAGFVLSAGYSHESDSYSAQSETIIGYAEHFGPELDVYETSPAVVDADDYWEVALRYAGEFNGVRLAAGVGYRNVDAVTGNDQDVWLGSGSVMHMPTGLFVSGGLAQVEWDSGHDQDGFWVMAGIEKNYFGPGTTTLFGEYSESNSDMYGDGSFWGLGVVQRIDAAATDLFVKYRHVEADDALIIQMNEGPNVVLDNTDANVVIGGMRIQF